jgi:uncharacterized membrane protein YkvA (DUF1232 family)
MKNKDFLNSRILQQLVAGRFNLRKVVIAILTLLYIISPYDIIPDFIIPVGWLDDLGVLGLLIYYFKKEKLPDIFSRRKESSEKKDV